jgi:GntR family transcriptional regulator
MVSGLLREGDQLPSLRDVVTQITINPNTVHRAYRELEHLGLVEGRLGLGTFVVEAVESAPREYRAQSWRDTLSEGVAQARSSGVGDDDIVLGLQSLLSSDAEVRS